MAPSDFPLKIALDPDLWGLITQVYSLVHYGNLLNLTYVTDKLEVSKTCREIISRTDV